MYYTLDMALDIVRDAIVELEEQGLTPSHPMWKQLDTISSKLYNYTEKYSDKLEELGLV